MTEASLSITRYPLLDTLRNLVKSRASIEASVLTTFTFDAAFYEEVLLRAFERAGSRLNIVIVDARQLATSMDDPLRQPARAGKDYLLAPVVHPTAFHPKILTLLSKKTSILSIGSHNATNSGFAHNEEITTFWGSECGGPSRGHLLNALEYCLYWLRYTGAAQEALLDQIEQRLDFYGRLAKDLEQFEYRFIGSHPNNQPLWAQTIDQIQSRVHRISVVSPYFDKDLRVLNRMSEELDPSEIIVGLQPDTAVLEAPESAPEGTRFVDSSTMGAFRTAASGDSFAHGKAILFETESGPIVCLGSANVTKAGWLGGEYSNAEAIVSLTGNAALKAATELGLNVLKTAPSVSPETLQAVAIRSQKQRKCERQRDLKIKSTPVIVGVRQGNAISVNGLSLEECESVVSLQSSVSFRSTNFTATEGGVILTTDPPLTEGGLVRIDGPEEPRAVVVINNEHALLAAMRPKAAAKVLDQLGRLENYDGFDEIFDLLQRHVFEEFQPSGGNGASKHNATAVDGTNRQPEPETAIPFGPRGISLAAIPQSRRQNQLLEDGLVSEIIAALLRAIGPVSKPALDGDARNLDAEDSSPSELSADDVAQAREIDPDHFDVNWPKLVMACRKRIGLMIRRLKNKLEQPIPGPDRAAWLFNRLLLVLCLLQRLRTLPPPSNLLPDGHMRPTSLVGVDQLREAFKAAMQGMYGKAGIARLLEESPYYRASDDRAMLDNILLWIAHEIGADFEERPVFNEQPADKARRLGDIADVVVVATSVAAFPLAQEVVHASYPSKRLWNDANTPSPDWFQRHHRLGTGFQSCLTEKRYPKLNRKPREGEFVFWVSEPGLPRLVRALSGDNAILVELGANDNSGKRIRDSYLDPIDLDAIIAGNSMGDPF